MKASENPFRSSQLERIRYALDADELKALVDQAVRVSCSCILGPNGTGKTTLLEDFEPYLLQRGFKPHWVRLQIDSTSQERGCAIKQLKQLNKQHVCLFDGAEVLNCWQWRRACNTARINEFSLIATLHRRPSIPILHHTQPNWTLADQLVRQLSGNDYDPQLRDEAKHAFEASEGNMREVFRACYLTLAQKNLKF